MKNFRRVCVWTFSVLSFAVVAQADTPTLGQLNSYDVVFAYTDFAPSDPVALGNVLADYVDAGGALVLATYAYSDPFGTDDYSVKGRIMTPGYAPLVNLGEGFVGDVSGSLVAVVPADPIFSGVDLPSLAYFHNPNFAHPGLDLGAELLATDGAGINMIARNAAGSIIGMNLFLAGGGFLGNNTELYELLNNSLLSVDPLAGNLLIVHGENETGLATPRDELLSFGDFSTIDEFDAAAVTPSPVPDSASTLLLMGLALFALQGLSTRKWTRGQRP
jgi:hypothetical protein